MSKALLLDRDGVLNREVGYVWQTERFEIQQPALELARDAYQAGYQLAIITNQGGIAKGLYQEADVQRLHALLARAFDSVGLEMPLLFYCPHHQTVYKCLCRKPGRLFFERALARLGADPQQSWMLGDNIRDLTPAWLLGLQTAYLHEDPPPPQFGGQVSLHVQDFGEGWQRLRMRLGLAPAL